MANGEDENFKQQLEILKRKFLCCYNLSELNIDLLPRPLDWLKQEQVLQHTYAHSLNEQFPIKVSYQLHFLRAFMKFLQENNYDVHDDVYEAYCDELQRSALVQSDLYAYKHYILPNFNTTVTLSESKSFVAQGTTGLCSWQASLALTDYLLCNPTIVEQKNVLELGAGTGLCSIIVKKCLNADQVILTDGSYECVKLMEKNVSLNFEPSDMSPPIPTVLQWDKIREFPWEKYKQPNLVLAADVVYDTSHLSYLTGAINFIFEKVNSEIKMLLAATVRNEATLQEFIEKLNDLVFVLKERDVITPDNSHLYWDRSTKIIIFEIERDKTKFEEMKALHQSQFD